MSVAAHGKGRLSMAKLTAESVIAEFDRWATETFRHRSIAGNTDAWNHLFAARETFKKRIRALQASGSPEKEPQT